MKIPCERHYRFVASCPDCRALNPDQEEKPASPRRKEEEPTPRQRSSQPEIPDLKSENSRNPEEDTTSPPPRRFRYTPGRRPRWNSRVITIVVVAGIVLLILLIYALPVWLAQINLQRQLYASKSGIDFWKIYTMNFWSTRFFFNKIGLIGAILGCLIMSLPPEASILKFFTTRFGWRVINKKKDVTSLVDCRIYLVFYHRSSDGKWIFCLNYVFL